MTATFRAGQVLGRRFELLEVSGVGGLSCVYRARDLSEGKTVAIKALLPEVLADPASAELLRRESEMASRLEHDNVVRVPSDGLRQEGPLPYLVMEFVRGIPLSRWLGSFPARRLSLGDFVPLAEQMLSGMAHAHARGIVHRDLKPGNIMVDEYRRVKILDFGIAAGVREVHSRATGRTVLLAVDYASPEVIRGERSTPASDVYSLGVTFFEMLAGRPPFSGPTVLEHHLRTPPPELPGAPTGVRLLVTRSLAKDPANRFQDAGVMREALRAATGLSRSRGTRRGAGRLVSAAVHLRARLSQAARKVRGTCEALAASVNRSRRQRRRLPGVLGPDLGTLRLAAIAVIGLLGGLLALLALALQG